jgi:hypothetical protein
MAAPSASIPKTFTSDQCLDTNLVALRRLGVERAMGIEPTAQAWEAWVLPLYDARCGSDSSRVPPRQANGSKLTSRRPSFRPAWCAEL